LIDNIPENMYVKDTTGHFVLANMQTARTYGFDDPQLLIGMSDFDLFPLEMAKKFLEDEQRVMSSGQPLFDHEENVFDAAGNSMHVLTTKVPLRDGRGQVTGIAGVAQDISERRKHDQALREAELKYRTLFDEAFVGLFELGPEGHVVSANPEMAEFLGYAMPGDIPANMPEPLWTRAVSPERSAELMARMKAAGYVRSFEMELRRNDGSKIWISTSVRAKWQNGALAGYAGMFEDITDRKLLREQLLQAQKLESVGQLAAGIAHEINTPMQYIGDNVRFLKDTFAELVALNVGYARLLAAVRSREVTPQILEEASLAVEKVDVDYLFEEIPKAIEQTQEGISRVAGLVGAMKEFSHPGTGERVLLDLNHAIESTITVARNEWKYVADMKVELDPTLPPVSCFPGEFNQVVLNLIVNAAHAIEDVAARGGPERGLITIQTRSLPAGVEVRIQDTGGGIPEQVRPRIFDPFFTTKEIGKGTGQGLAIARSVVVDKHQGTIEFETEDGHGTTFIIRLPCETVPSPSQNLAVA
jgi:PAS domain S-box-containing protein